MGSFDAKINAPRTLKEKNDESTLMLFNERVNYSSMLGDQLKRHPNLVDFQFAEKSLYGRVNRSFVPIKPRMRRIVSIPQATAPLTTSSRPLVVFNFVLRAFEKMQQEFARCSAQRTIDPTDKYLSTLKVYKAMSPIDNTYGNYINIYSGGFTTFLKNSSLPIKNFADFQQLLMKRMQKSAISYPFTQAGYVKGRHCTVMNTGLALEIADLPYDDDLKKRDEFFKSPNWEFYMNTCNKFGFMVDLNVPWRIVADLDSEAMKKYSRPLANGTTISSLFTLNFNRVAPYSFYNFKLKLFTLYRQCKKSSYLETQYCGGKLVHKHIVPKSYSLKSFLEEFDDTYFLKLYIQIRFWENEKKYTIAEQDQIQKSILAYAKLKGVSYGINVFEKLIAKTFDYSGSLSYIKRVGDALAAERADDSEDDSPIDYSEMTNST